MRIVQAPEQLGAALTSARTEAKAAFGVPDVYIEKYLKRPRHIEFQVLGDSFGNLVSLGERECSIQRRHQKLIEESPSTVLTPKLRRRMTEAALKLARAVGYQNAGTIEFLLDEDGRFYFMEMNTRIQVEHPVTEMVTGIDLIKEQLKVAAGESLAFRQEDIQNTGHSIECRINAEHPEKFTPSPGTITTFHLPGGPGVRIDTAAHPECRISPHYDSMIAKLITRGNNRMEAISRMRRSLEVMVVEGVFTTIPLQLKILNDPEFIRGNLHTGFLDRLLDRKEPAAVAS
jgi:acetyl-CoA carboxylase biotin carboxylase subunit